jgi:hypothetical protein
MPSFSAAREKGEAMDKCKFEHNGYCYNCGATQYIGKCKKPCDTIIPVTNADRIRSMSDEELAAFLSEWAERSLAWYGEYGETLDWLKQPVKDGDNDG